MVCCTMLREIQNTLFPIRTALTLELSFPGFSCGTIEYHNIYYALTMMKYEKNFFMTII